MWTTCRCPSKYYTVFKVRRPTDYDTIYQKPAKSLPAASESNQATAATSETMTTLDGTSENILSDAEVRDFDLLMVSSIGTTFLQRLELTYLIATKCISSVGYKPR